MADSSSSYDIVDLSHHRDRTKDWIEKIFGDLTKQSAAKQAAIGGVAGWGVGFLLVKVGKVAAASFGTTILLLQVAQRQGYIQVNWALVEKSLDKARSEMRNQAKTHSSSVLENVQTFIQNNIVLATSFAGGFFLGVAI